MDLQDLGVLLIDCQATGMNPASADLIDVAWCPLPGLQPDAFLESHMWESLVALPEGHKVPGRVRKITGISTADLLAAPHVSEIQAALRATLDDIGPAFVPVAHYARYERPFFEVLGLESPILCTHEIARRLLPDLPKLSLRALAGYLGATIEEHKRASSHIMATAVIWRELVPLLDSEVGIRTLPDLLTWIAETKPPRKGAKRTFGIPREVRLALPKQPGVYRLLNRNGDVLYVGKATNLKDRVNSYFRTRKGLGQRKLEMVSQVWGLDISPLETPLHAALLETDEIKRLAPPYNEMLRERERRVWFASPEKPSQYTGAPVPAPALGPFPSEATVAHFASLANALQEGAPEAMLDVLWGLEDVEIAREGLTLFCAWNGLPERPSQAQLLELGRALHISYCVERAQRKAEKEAQEEVEDEDEGDREAFVWTPPSVSGASRGVVRRLVMGAQRALWLAFLTDMTLSWRRPGEGVWRRLDIRRGQVSTEGPLDALEMSERLACFDVPTYDRLSVLSAELRRLVREGCDIRLTVTPGVFHDAASLANVFYTM